MTDTTEATIARSTRFIDAGVHPQVVDAGDLREYMAMPWQRRPFPGTLRYFYPFDGEEFQRPRSGVGEPGSDAKELAEDVLGDSGEAAILLPLTRGMLPDVDLNTEVCRATNRWLAERWLDDPQVDKRFKGSIRVDPRNPDAAVEEIEKWAKHPGFVQVAVPQKSQQPYGKRAFWPIWKAAADAGLPVATHADLGVGIDGVPTPVGYVSSYIEYAALHPFNFAYHMTSLIAEGPLEEFPELKFVFADGGFDYLRPYLWRFDKYWRGSRDDTPWVRQPSLYLPDHFRFLAHASELPRVQDWENGWLSIGDASNLLMFASNYPSNERMSPEGLFADAPEAVRERVLWRNAHELYGLDD